MIKFSAQTAAGIPVVGFGLSRRNCELLLEGRPIIVNLAELGLPPMEVIIFAGEDEAAMHKEFVAAGVYHGPLHPTPEAKDRGGGAQ